jgi:molybdenum cofactor cytidylyltransferase
VDGELLAALVQEQQNSGKSIVACSYGGIVGVPAVFSREMFPALMALQGQEGARKLISAKTEQLATVPFPNGIIDIDTIEDFLDLTDVEKKESGQG